MNGTETRDPRRAEDTLEELFRHAEARRKPPAAAEAAIRSALHAQWRELTARRRRRRLALAVAATAVLGAILAVIAVGPEPPAAPSLASVERVDGPVFAGTGPSRSLAPLGATEMVADGQNVATRAGGRLALRWRDGTAVRLDRNTEIRLAADGGFELVSGRVYMDTADARGPGTPPVIRTPAGSVRHLGTQYLTAVTGAGTTVSVREGQVILDRPDAALLAVKGEQLRIDPDGKAHRQAIEAFGPAWDWASELVPAWTPDGRTVADFLDWVSRETGREIEYLSTAVEGRAATTVVHGRVDQPPMAALAPVLQTTDLVSEVEDGVIRIRERGRF